MRCFGLFLVFLVLNASAANCPYERHALCSDVVGGPTDCIDRYQFYYNSDMVPLNYPVWCMDDLNSIYCKDSPQSPSGTSTGLCSPECSSFGKSITLSYCTAINTRSSCIASAGFDSAWCFWDAAAGVCRAAGIICH